MIYAEVPVRSEGRAGFLREWSQHKDSVNLFTLSASLYDDANTATVSTVTQQNVDNGLTIASPSLADPLWTAKISSTVAGRYTFQLLVAFSDGAKQCLEFCVNITDPG